jgi:putative acetyltransferase
MDRLEIQIIRTDAHHPVFQALIPLLDSELAVYDGEDHAFYDQYNKVDHINQVIVLMEGSEGIACGAFKPYDALTAEIKRMYVTKSHRGHGYSKSVLGALENWAAELGFKRCILETGKVQMEAVALYKSAGYEVMSNFGPYIGIDKSVCFQKVL